MLALLKVGADNPRMLAERPLPADIDARIAALGAAWQDDAEIAAVYLFGSRARGNAGPRSDVDLSVVLSPELDGAARWRKCMDLYADAIARLGTDAVDVVVLEDAPTVLAHRVLSRGRLLSRRDDVRRARVAERVMRNYLDEEYLRRVLDEGLARRLREGTFAR